MDLSQRYTRSEYVAAVAVTAAAIAAGLFIQFFTKAIPKEWFSFPYNLWIGLAFIGSFTTLYLLWRDRAIVKTIAGVPFAIVATATLGILTIGLGSIHSEAGANNAFIQKLGLGNITTTWYFAICLLLVLINLWFAVLKRSLYFQKKNIVFLLNHLGLWLVLFAGVLGQGDLVRLTMELKEGSPEWRAADEHGHLVELPVALELQKFTMDVYPNKLYIINRDGSPLPLNKPESFSLEKDSSFHTILQWQIELKQYLPNAVLVKENTWENNPMWGSSNAAFITVKNLNSGKDTTGWIAAGNFQFPPQTIMLDSQHILVMAPPEAKKFESEVLVFHKNDTTIRREKIQVNHPITVDGWKIYQTSYNEKLGRWSDSSTVELIMDPWLPLVYAGIGLLILGSIGFLIKSRK